ncbi:hypothetical protein V866_001207 [Kwoniella sp. B9012]
MNVDKAVAYHKKHPSVHIKDVLKRFKVPKSTFDDHLNGTHSARGVNTARNLTLQQEAALVGTINDFARRGTFLAPRHIRELANRFTEEPVGKNWPSTFIRRHNSDISSKFFRFQEIARIEADTPSNRAAFYELVKSIYDDYFYPSHDLYNMDETGFTLSNEFNERGVSPRETTSKSKGTLLKDTHITVVAAISTCDSPVPPYLIYPGQQVIEEWTTPRDNEPKMIGAIEVSGPETPEDSRVLQALDRSVRRGEVDPKTAFFKTQKALEKISAEKVLVEVELNKRKAAEELDKEARGSKKQTRYPKGKFFDQKYQETHATELSERKEREREAMEKARRKHHPKQKKHASKTSNKSRTTILRTVRGLQATACVRLEELSD